MALLSSFLVVILLAMQSGGLEELDTVKMGLPLNLQMGQKNGLLMGKDIEKMAQP